MMFQQPILLLIFNRPETTVKVFEKIRQIKPERLYIAADGPRPGHSVDQKACEQTRKIVMEIDWKCEVKTLFREQNLGCGRAISEGITWFFEYEESGIILEDDCVPDVSFFLFCDKLLRKYEHDERVMMVSGTSYVFEDISGATDYYFCRYYSVWGWATWRRAWKLYDYDISSWPEQKASGYLEYVLENKAMAKVYSGMFDLIREKKTDTWDLQWVHCCISNNGLAATSSVNLIKNIGAVGTHTVEGATEPYLKMPVVGQARTEGLEKNRSVHVDHVYERMAFTALIERFFGDPRTADRSSTFSALYRGVKHRLRQLLTKPSGEENRVVTIGNEGTARKRALLSYLNASVQLEPGDPGLSGPSNKWESREIALMLVRKGFVVDVINWNDESFIPRHKYDLMIDIAFNLQRLAGFLPDDCIKILHLTGSYWDFAIEAELSRVKDLENRRRTGYSPRRLPLYPQLQERSLRIADNCSLIGNQTTLDTYPQQFRSKITAMAVTTSELKFIKTKSQYVPQEKEFLWFNSSGMVHKGLDLLLEIFFRHPEWKLNIVGSPEYDLFHLYETELKNSGNIRIHGFVDPGSGLFQNILRRSFCFICPSCSEGMSGSSATCMQAGLYPVLSASTGIDLPPDAGIILDDCTIACIEKTIAAVWQKSGAELTREIAIIQQKAFQTFSREKFTEVYTEFLDHVLAEKK